ncbi:PucR C-terminal helix-turn-helix domain-containing protein [Klenkia marina]|uniref:PucR C-terminal helix-turn-helix domain-containing protein n=1 Tax=Klenkia marina TaxID=1960309 RepID=A0A1G4Z5C2_9ACTN|nr:helix-turn-helix domain-containing protein [Klenkia marina]SCX60865.1 PucR C-terminal helix-turn-helix domain-containing protein [Klenkia marina]
MRDDLQDLVDEVSRLLGAPATLEDTEFTLLAFCAQGDEVLTGLDAVRTRSILTRGSTVDTRRWFTGFGIDEATEPLRTPADPVAGVLTRLCLPVRHRGRLHGWLWLLDEGRTDLGQPDPPGLAAARELADRAGALLATRPTGGTADDLRAALTGDEAAAHRLTGRLGRDTPVAVVALRPGPEGLPDGWVSPGAGAVSAPVGPLVAVLLPVPHVDDDRPAVALSAAALHRLPPGSTAGVAVPRAGCHDLPAQWREAVDAARVAAVEPTLAPVASWAELGAWRQVVLLPGPDPAFAALLADPVLARTAEVWLDRAGSPRRAAAELVVHRQTLYYRLGRIAELTGLDLADGGDRLALHLALRSARLDAAGRGARPVARGDLGSTVP